MTKEQQLNNLWDEFLHKFPLENLCDIRLENYTSQGDDTSFCYWLESKLGQLGSVWGGSSFKFGIYQRKDKSEKSNSKRLCYTAEYAWYCKYGSTPEEAFSNVRDIIVNIALSAHSGNLTAIEQADLGEAIKWKIAFLYQDRNTPIILPIYKSEMLKVLVGKDKGNHIEAYKHLIENQDDKPLFEYAESLWNKATDIIEKQFSPQSAEDFFNNSPDFEAVKEPTKKLAGFRSISDKEVALRRTSGSGKVTLYFSDGSWVDSVQELFSDFERYESNSERSSNLAANAPSLKLGNPILRVVVSSLENLEKICNAYLDENPVFTNHKSDNSNPAESDNMNISLNQILYGPPGVGKTYATVEKAVEIAEPQKFSLIKNNRNEVKKLYDELVSEDRVVFTTFHQSFSYEDFIEGIRANTNEETKQIEYKIEDGIFKKIAETAAKSISINSDIGLSDSPTIWKLSIGRTYETELRQKVIDAGEARIGWNDTGDVSQPLDDRSEKEQEYWEKSLSSRNRSAITAFSNDIKIGDVVLCLKNSTTIQAIGIVQSDYFFEHDYLKKGNEYAHVRKVNWIAKNIELNILPLNENTRLVQQTCYQLPRMSWNKLISELPKQNIELQISTEGQKTSSKNYVMVIDEINRGNIARIFGELITLLEADKRMGAPDERSAILPYSKKPFSIPDNLFILGTMNTADKSLTQLDLALRRRFEFIEMLPKAELLNKITVHDISIQNLLELINQRIEVLLDRDHLIGHSYFLGLKDAKNPEEALAEIFKKGIIPLLQEYFFSDWERIGWVLNDIEKDKNHRFIHLKEEANELSNIFSSKVIGNLRDRRYVINQEAFTMPEAYQGIFTKEPST